MISLSGLTLEVSGCLSLRPQPGAAGFTHIKLLSECFRRCRGLSGVGSCGSPLLNT